jgi:S1-C subfamily serine protease
MAMRIPVPVLWLLLVLAACGARVREPATADRRPGAAPAQPRATVLPQRPKPETRHEASPDCDPRAGDPDRGRVGMGLLAGDCQDERGRNAAYVTRLVPVAGPQSPAQVAGIQAGDRLVRFDACEIASSGDVAARLRRAVPGWMARVVVERGGREIEIFVPTVKLSDRAESPGPRHLSTAGCRAIGRPPAR